MYGFQCDLLTLFRDIRMSDITTDNLKQYLGEATEHLKPYSLGRRVRFVLRQAGHLMA
ncbi:hypothetical protein [Oceanobacillus caeni]|uniref:hypothetical protein n=1 Tax=Oceanobacillus caeni TaxID=405946 RepID=UPI0036D2A419